MLHYKSCVSLVVQAFSSSNPSIEAEAIMNANKNHHIHHRLPHNHKRSSVSLITITIIYHHHHHYQLDAIISIIIIASCPDVGIVGLQLVTRFLFAQWLAHPDDDWDGYGL